MEEGLSDEGELRADLRARTAFPSVIDLRKAHDGIADTEKLFDPEKTVCQRTWRPMCDLMLRRSDIASPALAQRNEYQALNLGRKDGDTLLAEVMPYPNGNTHRWPYAKISRFATRDEYTKELEGPRIDFLRDALSKPPHELIVAYGKGMWSVYENVFRESTSWRNRDSVFRVGAWNEARVVLTHHLTRGFDSDGLVRFARVTLG